MRKTLLLSVLICLLLTLPACSSALPTPAIDRKTPLFETASQVQNRLNAQQQAGALVAEQTNLPAEQISLITAQPAVWNNLCLELPNPGEDCPAEQVRGFLFIFQAANQTVEVHASQRFCYSPYSYAK